MRVRAFRAVRPDHAHALNVASVPYDTVDTDEARELAEGNPSSFLHVIRPEIDLPRQTDVHADEVYAKAAENFARLRESGVLVQDDEAAAYVYRLQMGDHVQSGIVVCCHVQEYEGHRVLRHEKTRKDKEDDRTRHVLTLNANAGPVFLTYRGTTAIDARVAGIESGAPLYDLTAEDGVKHTIWRVPGESLAELFGDVPCCYVADGHHRAAAAARAGRERQAANPEHRGDEEYNWFLGVLFPADQLQILPYNRCVADLNGLSVDEFLAAVRREFDVTPDADSNPAEPGRASMYVDGRWYGLSWRVPEDAGPVASLDVSVLQDQLLAPTLGIDDPRTSRRIVFIGGIRGTDELAQRVDSGRDAVGFSMFPVTVDQMMAIADAGEIMPPKSTWFEPKLRSGLLVHLLD